MAPNSMLAILAASLSTVAMAAPTNSSIETRNPQIQINLYSDTSCNNYMASWYASGDTGNDQYYGWDAYLGGVIWASDANQNLDNALELHNGKNFRELINYSQCPGDAPVKGFGPTDCATVDATGNTLRLYTDSCGASDTGYGRK